MSEKVRVSESCSPAKALKSIDTALLLLNVIETLTYTYLFIIQYTVKYTLMNSSQHTRFEIIIYKITDTSYCIEGGGISWRFGRRQWHFTTVYKHRL